MQWERGWPGACIRLDRARDLSACVPLQPEAGKRRPTPDDVHPKR